MPKDIICAIFPDKKYSSPNSITIIFGNNKIEKSSGIIPIRNNFFTVLTASTDSHSDFLLYFSEIFLEKNFFK